MTRAGAAAPSTYPDILIHTSVKLVTTANSQHWGDETYFNPHEREARDPLLVGHKPRPENFNPHEREARDLPIQFCAEVAEHFNPHEREARDYSGSETGTSLFGF